MIWLVSIVGLLSEMRLGKLRSVIIVVILICAYSCYSRYGVMWLELEVIRWPGNGSLTIELDQVYPGENIEIDFGKPEIATWGSLEISANGKDWSKVNFTQKNNRLTASLQQKPIKAVRFTNMPLHR